MPTGSSRFHWKVLPLPICSSPEYNLPVPPLALHWSHWVTSTEALHDGEMTGLDPLRCVCIWAPARSASTPQATPHPMLSLEPAHPSFTFINVKLIVIPGASTILQVQLHGVVEVPFLSNLLHFLPRKGGGVQTESEAEDLAASSLPSPETHPTPICEPSEQCQSTPHDLGPYPLLRGLQVCPQDVVVDTFVTKPQGEGALNEDRPGWVVAGQGGLLIRTLDTWCGSMHTQGALAESKGPGSPPSRPRENPAARYAGPYLQYAAQGDLLYLWSLWMKPSAKKNRGGSFWPPTEELGRNGEGGPQRILGLSTGLSTCHSSPTLPHFYPVQHNNH